MSYVVTVKSDVEISQNFVAFSEYMNYIRAKLYVSGFSESIIRSKSDVNFMSKFNFYFSVDSLFNMHFNSEASAQAWAV